MVDACSRGRAYLIKPAEKAIKSPVNKLKWSAKFSEKLFFMGRIYLLSNSFQNVNLSFDNTGTASMTFAVIIHSWDLFPFKCKREAEFEGQTSPEVIVASLKSQGKKERARVDTEYRKKAIA